MAEEATWSDVAAITELILRYREGCDDQDAEVVMSCFSDDVVFEHDDDRQPTKGIEAARRSIEGIPTQTLRSTGLNDVVRISSVMGIPRVTVEGGRATSRSRCTATLIGRKDGDLTAYLSGICYEFDFRRDASRWWITRRFISHEWGVTLPVAAGIEIHAKARAC